MKICYDVPLVTLMGPTPCYLQSQVVFACQSFRSVASFIFLAKYNFRLFFFKYRKGYGHIDMFMAFP